MGEPTTATVQASATVTAVRRSHGKDTALITVGRGDGIIPLVTVEMSFEALGRLLTGEHVTGLSCTFYGEYVGPKEAQPHAPA